MDLLYIKILKSPSMKLWRHGGIKWVMLCLCKESSMCIWSVPKCTTNERAAWSSKLDNHDCVTTAPRKHGSDGYFATTWLQRKLGNWLSYVVCVTSPSTGCRGGLRVSDQWSRTDTGDAPYDARCRRRMKPGNPVSRTALGPGTSTAPVSDPWSISRCLENIDQYWTNS